MILWIPPWIKVRGKASSKLGMTNAQVNGSEAQVVRAEQQMRALLLFLIMTRLIGIIYVVSSVRV
jgi:hypothetical protein